MVHENSTFKIVIFKLQTAESGSKLVLSFD